MKKHRLRTKPEEVLFPVNSNLSIANQKSMSRPKLWTTKFLKISIIFLIISAWIYSGFPQIWHNPPEIQMTNLSTELYRFRYI